MNPGFRAFPVVRECPTFLDFILYIHLHVYIYIIYEWDPMSEALCVPFFLHGEGPPPNFIVSKVFMTQWPGRLPGYTPVGSSGLSGRSLGSLGAGVMRCTERIRTHQSRVARAVNVLRHGRCCGRNIRS